MSTYTPEREFAFLVNDVARLLRTYADQRVRECGMTRAQWVVLVKLERCQGLKQAELAEQLDLRPITLTRLIDRLCASGLVERRGDPDDRRAKRLFLLPAALPVVEELGRLGQSLMVQVLGGIDREAVDFMLNRLGRVKDNLRALVPPDMAAAGSIATDPVGSRSTASARQPPRNRSRKTPPPGFPSDKLPASASGTGRASRHP